MSITTPAAATASPSPAAAVLRAELRLFRREPAGLFWIMAFPTLLLVVLGSIPSFREPSDSLGGLRTVDLYVPVSVLLAMVMAGLQAMPPVLTGYRERGILRRMSTTPVRPAALLSSQMALHGAAALVSVLLSIAVGRLAFGVPLPRQAFGYLLALALSVVAALSLGALVSALSRTAKTANSAGAALFFPMMFTAGLWLPVRAMPHLLARVVECLPFGAAAQALTRAGAGDWPGWTQLGVLTLWTAVLCGAAVRWFRWE
ncbi:ABC transporter permease [Streptomyces sp. YS-3]|uniref:ABC transporter permease n=1 Tax=Streptomyces sp. YS-3 TaxID=3381352 RepID=UPI00386276AA